MQNKLNIELENLKTQFKVLLGESHILFGLIEYELKSIWYFVCKLKKITDEAKIENKWKKISKMTLGQIIDEIDFLAIYSDEDLFFLRKDVLTERNYITHNIQEIFYDDLNLNDYQNEQKLLKELSKEIKRLGDNNHNLREIVDNLCKDRLFYQKKVKQK